MDPMSLIGAGTSLVGGIMGANAARQANEENWQINLANFMLANEERMDRIKAEYRASDERDKERIQQQMGSTDAQGNRTYYDPQRGWVTDLSYQGKQRQEDADRLADAQNSERMKELTQDIPLQRYQATKNFEQNAQYRDQVGIFQKMLHDALISGPSKYSGTDAQLYNQQAQSINDAYNAQTEEATRDAVRQGSNITGVMSDLARSRMKDLNQASMAAALQGRQQRQQDYQGKISNLLNLYNAFTQNSRSDIGSPSYNPVDASSFNPASNALANAQVSAAAQLQMNDGMQQIADAYGQKGGRVDYVQPDYGMANALAGFGNILGGMGKRGGGGGGGLGSGLFGASSGSPTGTSSGNSGGGMSIPLLGNLGIF